MEFWYNDKLQLVGIVSEMEELIGTIGVYSVQMKKDSNLDIQQIQDYGRDKLLDEMKQHLKNWNLLDNN